MKNWLIKQLGGYTRDEHEALRKGFDAAVAEMKRRDRFGMFAGDNAVLHSPHVEGGLVAAPGVTIIGGYFENNAQNGAPVLSEVQEVTK